MAYQINDYYFNTKYDYVHQDQMLRCDNNILTYNGPMVELNDSYTLFTGANKDISRINVAELSDPVIMKSKPEIIFYLYERLLWIKDNLYNANPELYSTENVNNINRNIDPYKKWFEYILNLIYKVSLSDTEKKTLLDFINTYITLSKYPDCLRSDLDTFYEKVKVFVTRIQSEPVNGNYYEGYNLIYNKVFNEAKENSGNSQSNSYQRTLVSGNPQQHKPIPIPLPPETDEERLNNAAHIDLFVIIFLILATIAGVITFIAA